MWGSRSIHRTVCGELSLPRIADRGAEGTTSTEKIKKVNMNDKKRRAIRVDREVRELVRGINRAWFQVGRLCERCRNELLYIELGFKTFDSWIDDAVGCSRSRAYVAMRVTRDLVPIRDADLNRMTMQNADLLSRVPKSKQAELVQAAQMQTEQEFRSTVDAVVPGLHLEDKVHVEFWVPRSLAEAIESCIEMAKVLNETDSRASAIEAIFAEYNLNHSGQRYEETAEFENAPRAAK
jgi:hypothetical protein